MLFYIFPDLARVVVGGAAVNNLDYWSIAVAATTRCGASSVVQMVVRIGRCVLWLGREASWICGDSVSIWSERWSGSSRGGSSFRFSSALCGERITVLSLVATSSTYDAAESCWNSIVPRCYEFGCAVEERQSYSRFNHVDVQGDNGIM